MQIKREPDITSKFDDAGSLFIDDFHSSRCYGAAAAPIVTYILRSW
mgnify:CR=1 FL=1